MYNPDNNLAQGLGTLIVCYKIAFFVATWRLCLYFQSYWLIFKYSIESRRGVTDDSPIVNSEKKPQILFIGERLLLCQIRDVNKIKRLLGEIC